MGFESVSVILKNKIYILGLIITVSGILLGLIRTSVHSAPSSQLARVSLGRFLFYDNRLSYNQTKSCVSCHDPKLAFTDGYRKSVGADGYAVKHNAPSLLNAVYRTSLTWKDSTVNSLYRQLHFPLFNQSPNELGWTSNETQILKRLALVPAYRSLFKSAFPTAKKWFTTDQIKTAIVAFEEQLVSYGSAYDMYIKGNKNAMDDKAVMGMAVFNSSKTNCSKCHLPENTFQSISSGFADGVRIPSLRNVWITAPYMHDGRLDNIEDVIEHYEAKYTFKLDKAERQHLLAFMMALTDTSYLSKTELLNPFQY